MMTWTKSEFLFYGGLAITALSAIAMIISIFLVRFHKKRLNEHLDKAYGEKD